MIKQAIEKIQELANDASAIKEFSIGKRNYIMCDGRTYDDRPVTPNALMFRTLTGLADYISGGFDSGFIHGNPIIHVVDHESVEFFDEARDDYGNRCVLAQAHAELPDEFPFGSFMDGETFMIRIQSLFVPHVGDWDEVVKNCAGIKKMDGIEYKDNGVTQTVAAQSGLSLAGTKKVPNPVTLAPYRTFSEIEQPASSFVLRVTDGRMCPELALFEADGGAWRLTAMQAIKAWLDERLPGYTVIA